MNREIAVVCSAFSEAQRERIRTVAEAQGDRAFFYQNAAEARGHLAEAEILLAGDAELLPEAKRARWVCSPSAGVEHLVQTGLFDTGEVRLTNSSGCYGVTIAEHIVMVSLMLLRRQLEYTEIVQRRVWRRDLPIRSLRGSRITLVGTGDIGREAAKRLRAFGAAALIGLNRSGHAVPELDETLPVTSLESVLPKTDLLILSLPATAQTRGLMSAERLALLPAHALVVNVGRGSSLDQKALEKLLREGKLGGAALDVFEAEPLPPEDTLWTCPNLLVTPHTSGNMTLGYTVDRCVTQFLEDLVHYDRGEPLQYQVDVQAGY